MRGRNVLILIGVAAVVLAGGGVLLLLLRLDDSANERKLTVTTDPTDGELEPALQYASLKLPDEAEVLAVGHSLDRVEEYRFVIAVPPGIEQQLLQGSNFTETFKPSTGASAFSLEGFEIPDDRPTMSAHESSDDDAVPMIAREITIDKSDTQRTMLYIMAWSP